MDFDKSNVYTAANADDLHKGDLCFFADSLGVLKERVKDEVGGGILSNILEEDKSMRFVSDCNSCYELAYLVCPVRNFDAFRAWKRGKLLKYRSTAVRLGFLQVTMSQPLAASS
jgi:hypothetical protein